MQIQPRDFVSRRQHGAQLQLCVPQVVTDGDSYRMREARAKGGTTPEEELTNPRGRDFYLATSGDRNLAVDSAPGNAPCRRRWHDRS